MKVLNLKHLKAKRKKSLKLERIKKFFRKGDLKNNEVSREIEKN